MHIENVDILTTSNRFFLDRVSVTYMSSWMIPHLPLGCKDVTGIDKVT